MEEAVVKKGLLYLQQQQTFGKKWRKCWGVLYREEACASARLELLLEGSRPPAAAPEKARRGESGRRRLIKLDECVHVAEAGGGAGSPKETSPFLLETTGKCYLLAAERGEAADWILELCRHAFVRSSEDWKVMQEKDLPQGTGTALSMAENSLYSLTGKAEKQFSVAVRATPASERCQLWGRFLLYANADALELCAVQNGDVLYAWPYKFLRRFGHDKVIFSFEAGRRCISGEGSFEFATKQGGEIIRVIEAAISAQWDSRMHDPGRGASPSISSSVAALPARAASQAKYDEGAQGGKATAWGEGLPSRAVSAKSLSLELCRQGKPAMGKLVKPTDSCPLSNTRSPSVQLPESHPRQDPHCGPKVWERSGKIVAPQVKVVPELEYAEPFDMVSKSLGNLDGSRPLHSTEGPPDPFVSHDQTDGLGLAPARVRPEQHIYDEPEVLAHLVYDEPQEIKGEAWRLQAMAEDPVGHEFPYNPCLDDYSVPKMGACAPVQLPGQDKAGLGGMACDPVILSLKNKRNAP